MPAQDKVTDGLVNGTRTVGSQQAPPEAKHPMPKQQYFYLSEVLSVLGYWVPGISLPSACWCTGQEPQASQYL